MQATQPLAPDAVPAPTHQQQQQELADATASTGGPGGGCGGAGAGGSGGGGDGSSGGGGGFDPIGMLVRGVQGRLEADPSFAFRLLVQCGLDAGIILFVNYTSRGARFWKEMDFTLCHLATALASDFALVYLLAPTAATRAPPRPGTLRASLAALPAHAFQGPATGFTLGQRGASLALKGVQYGVVGMAMGALGTATVNGLTALRERRDQGFQAPDSVQSAARVALLWGLFLASSANIRFNTVALCEDLLFAASPAAGQLGSTALRLGNNYLGAAQWVRWTKAVNLNRPWRRAALVAA